MNSRTLPRPLYRAIDFIKLNENLEFQLDQHYYAELYVKPKFLNVRNSPQYGDVVGTTFSGQKIPIYAKSGEWVAISRKFENFENQFWVHSRYLSPTKTDRIAENGLLSRCGLDEMVRMLDGIERTNGCKSVQKYLLWEGSSEYRRKLEQHLRSLDKMEISRNLNHCTYPFF